MHEYLGLILFTALISVASSLKYKNKANYRPISTRLGAIESSSLKAQDGLDIHVLKSTSTSKGSSKCPLLFIHGSYHSAYCWGDHFLPYFESKGYDCLALSLRGTGPTGMLEGDESKSVDINSHISDVKKVLSSFSQPPVIIAHSFGGLVSMKLLEDDDTRSKTRGVVTLCSVPPSGNGPMTGRFLKRDIWSALQITRGFVLKTVRSSPKLCRELFFDDSVSDEDISLYMDRFKKDSVIGIDLGSLKGNLPSDTSMSENGIANFLDSDTNLRRLCLGAENDYIVDHEGVEETARYLGVVPTFIKGAYHDCFVGPIWKRTATTIEEWLEQ